VSCRIHARAPRHAAAPRIDTDPAVLATFLSDAAHVPGGHAAGVVFPKSEAELAAVVSASARVLPIGAQSSLTGGATPRGEIILSTRALATIDVMDRHAVAVGAGVPLASLQDYLARHGRYYPPVPTYDGAFVGGTIATNAAGAATFKYGATRPWVQAMTVVLADGSVLDLVRGHVLASAGRFEIGRVDGSVRQVPAPRYTMPAVAKLSAGYFAAPDMDLIDLFIGSEGTLGVVVSATLRVIDRPDHSAVLITCRDPAQAIAVTARLRVQARLAWRDQGALDVSAIEYMDARALRVVPDAAFARAGVPRPPEGAVMLLAQLEFARGGDAARAGEGLAGLVELGEVLDSAGVESDPIVTVPGDERGAQRFFELREAVPASVNALVAAAKQADAAIEKTAGDFVVPFERLEESIGIYHRHFTDRDIDHAVWGHASDGNLHVNVIPTTLRDVTEGREALIEMARAVIAMGGAPLAEHGVGRSAMKQRLLRELYGEDGIEQMRAVKRALDPEWKLSPGVLFPAP
jgi:D-lactate dehydrogenase (cytochrome)